MKWFIWCIIAVAVAAFSDTERTYQILHSEVQNICRGCVSQQGISFVTPRRFYGFYDHHCLTKEMVQSETFPFLVSYGYFITHEDCQKAFIPRLFTRRNINLTRVPEHKNRLHMQEESQKPTFVDATLHNILYFGGKLNIDDLLCPVFQPTQYPSHHWDSVEEIETIMSKEENSNSPEYKSWELAI